MTGAQQCYVCGAEFTQRAQGDGGRILSRARAPMAGWRDAFAPAFQPNEQLRAFVSDLFGGLHHAPNESKWKWESPTQVSMTCRADGWATFDGEMLTRLVLLAHARAVRVELSPRGPGYLELRFSQRKREGAMHERHPTIEQAIAEHVKRFGPLVSQHRPEFAAVPSSEPKGTEGGE